MSGVEIKCQEMSPGQNKCQKMSGTQTKCQQMSESTTHVNEMSRFGEKVEKCPTSCGVCLVRICIFVFTIHRLDQTNYKISKTWCKHMRTFVENPVK